MNNSSKTKTILLVILIVIALGILFFQVSGKTIFPQKQNVVEEAIPTNPNNNGFKYDNKPPTMTRDIFTLENNSITVKKNGGSGGTYTLKGIQDSSSFVGLTDFIGKDKYHVYLLGTHFSEDGTEDTEIIPDADPQSIQVINDRFFKDKSHVWGGFRLILQNADPATFVLINDFYEKTKDTVYNGVKILNNADAKTFIALGTHHVKDVNHVFDFKGDILNKIVDVPNLISLDDGTWFKDSVHIYSGNGEIVDQADPASFVALKNYYGKDKNHVFFGTINFVTESTPKKATIVTEADPQSFTVINAYYQKDKSHIFVGGKILADADVATFKQINDFYFKDKSHVWVDAEGGGYIQIIPDADSSTFVVNDKIPQQAEDANYIYGLGTKGGLGKKKK